MVPFSGGTLNSQTKTLNFVVAAVLLSRADGEGSPKRRAS